MKEKRKGPIGRAAAVAEGLAATVRRMQREREPRVLVYDETGYARLVQPNGRGYERLLETAERMVALTDEAEVKRPEAAEADAEAGAPDGEPAIKPRRAKRAAANGDEAKPKAKAPRAKRAAPKAGGAAKPRRTKRPASAGEAGPARPKRAAKPARSKRAGSSQAESKPRRTRRGQAPSGDDE